MQKNFEDPPLSPFAATVEQLLHEELAAELSAQPTNKIDLVDRPSDRYVMIIAKGFRASKIDAALDRLGYNRFPAGYGGRGKSSVVCYPGYVHAIIEEDRFLLHARVSYQGRETAKRAGFNWKPDTGKWVKLVDVNELQVLEDTALFKFHIEQRIFDQVHAAVPEEENAKPSPVKQKPSPGAELAAMRRTFGGPAKAMRPCRWCSRMYSARELRIHQGPCGRAKRA